MTASNQHLSQKPDRITDWTWQVGTVRSAIDTLTAVSHREEVDDAELHENSLNAYAALDWLAGEHERLEEQLEALQRKLAREQARKRLYKEVLAEARDLAVAVADKDIGRLSDRARKVQGKANDALGDIPSAEEVAGILATSNPAKERP